MDEDQEPQEKSENGKRMSTEGNFNLVLFIRKSSGSGLELPNRVSVMNDEITYFPI